MEDEPKKKPRAKRSFTAEFRAGVVDLVLREGKTPAQVARDLDLTATSVRQWVKQARIDLGEDKSGALTTDERQELSQLRRKVRQLEMERDILKKAAAFFAKESG
jgi:transposase